MFAKVVLMALVKCQNNVNKNYLVNCGLFIFLAEHMQGSISARNEVCFFYVLFFF